MKKYTWLFLCLFMGLALAACGGEADKVALLETKILHLTQERDDEILASFRDNLHWMTDFLGVYDFCIDDEDIEKQGNIVTVRTSYLYDGVVLTFRY